MPVRVKSRPLMVHFIVVNNNDLLFLLSVQYFYKCYFVLFNLVDIA